MTVSHHKMMETQTRTCKRCLRDLELCCFYKNATNKTDGRRSICKGCLQPDERIRDAKRYTLAEDRPRFWHSAKIHNTTIDELERMLAAQGGVCYLCGELPSGKFHVDHDHSCCPDTVDGKRVRKTCGQCIRGLACQRCNQVIGMVKECPELLRRLADKVEQLDAKLRPTTGIRPSV